MPTRGVRATLTLLLQTIYCTLIHLFGRTIRLRALCTASEPAHQSKPLGATTAFGAFTRLPTWKRQHCDPGCRLGMEALLAAAAAGRINSSTVWHESLEGKAPVERLIQTLLIVERGYRLLLLSIDRLEPDSSPPKRPLAGDSAFETQLAGTQSSAVGFDGAQSEHVSNAVPQAKSDSSAECPGIRGTNRGADPNCTLSSLSMPFDTDLTTCAMPSDLKQRAASPAPAKDRAGSAELSDTSSTASVGDAIAQHAGLSSPAQQSSVLASLYGLGTATPSFAGAACAEAVIKTGGSRAKTKLESLNSDKSLTTQSSRSGRSASADASRRKEQHRQKGARALVGLEPASLQPEAAGEMRLGAQGAGVQSLSIERRIALPESAEPQDESSCFAGDSDAALTRALQLQRAQGHRWTRSVSRLAVVGADTELETPGAGLRRALLRPAQSDVQAAALPEGPGTGPSCPDWNPGLGLGVFVPPQHARSGGGGASRRPGVSLQSLATSIENGSAACEGGFTAPSRLGRTRSLPAASPSLRVKEALGVPAVPQGIQRARCLRLLGDHLACAALHGFALSLQQSATPEAAARLLPTLLVPFSSPTVAELDALVGRGCSQVRAVSGSTAMMKVLRLLGLMLRVHPRLVLRRPGDATVDGGGAIPGLPVHDARATALSVVEVPFVVGWECCATAHRALSRLAVVVADLPLRLTHALAAHPVVAVFEPEAEGSTSGGIGPPGSPGHPLSVPAPADDIQERDEEDERPSSLSGFHTGPVSFSGLAPMRAFRAEGQHQPMLAATRSRSEPDGHEMGNGLVASPLAALRCRLHALQTPHAMDSADCFSSSQGQLLVGRAQADADWFRLAVSSSAVFVSSSAVRWSRADIDDVEARELSYLAASALDDSRASSNPILTAEEAASQARAVRMPVQQLRKSRSQLLARVEGLLDDFGKATNACDSSLEDVFHRTLADEAADLRRRVVQLGRGWFARSVLALWVQRATMPRGTQTTDDSSSRYLAEHASKVELLEQRLRASGPGSDGNLQSAATPRGLRTPERPGIAPGRATGISGAHAAVLAPGTRPPATMGRPAEDGGCRPLSVGVPTASEPSAFQPLAAADPTSSKAFAPTAAWARKGTLPALGAVSAVARRRKGGRGGKRASLTAVTIAPLNTGFPARTAQGDASRERPRWGRSRGAPDSRKVAPAAMAVDGTDHRAGDASLEFGRDGGALGGSADAQASAELAGALSGALPPACTALTVVLSCLNDARLSSDILRLLLLAVAAMEAGRADPVAEVIGIDSPATQMIALRRLRAVGSIIGVLSCLPLWVPQPHRQDSSGSGLPSTTFRACDDSHATAEAVRALSSPLQGSPTMSPGNGAASLVRLEEAQMRLPIDAAGLLVTGLNAGRLAASSAVCSSLGRVICAVSSAASCYRQELRRAGVAALLCHEALCSAQRAFASALVPWLTPARVVAMSQCFALASATLDRSRIARLVDVYRPPRPRDAGMSPHTASFRNPGAETDGAAADGIPFASTADSRLNHEATGAAAHGDAAARSDFHVRTLGWQGVLDAEVCAAEARGSLRVLGSEVRQMAAHPASEQPTLAVGAADLFQHGPSSEVGIPASTVNTLSKDVASRDSRLMKQGSDSAIKPRKRSTLVALGATGSAANPAFATTTGAALAGSMHCDTTPQANISPAHATVARPGVGDAPKRESAASGCGMVRAPAAVLSSPVLQDQLAAALMSRYPALAALLDSLTPSVIDPAIHSVAEVAAINATMEHLPDATSLAAVRTHPSGSDRLRSAVTKRACSDVIGTALARVAEAMRPAVLGVSQLVLSCSPRSLEAFAESVMGVVGQRCRAMVKARAPPIVKPMVSAAINARKKELMMTALTEAPARPLKETPAAAE